MPEIVRKYKEKSQIFIKDKFTEDGAGWLLLQQIIIAPMSLLTTVLLAKVLSITDYGYYKYVLSIYSIVAIFGMTGFYNIASMNIQRGQDDFFYLGFKYRKLLRWVPVIVSLCISLYYFYFGNNFLAILFLITIIAHLLADTYDFYSVMTYGKGDFKLNSILAILNYFFGFIPPIIVAYFSHNLYYIFTTMFLSQFLFRFFAFYYVKNRLGFKDEIKKYFSKEIEDKYKKESYQLSFNNSVNTIGVNASSAIIFNRLGAENNAVYSLAITFADFVGGIISAPFSKVLLSLSNMTKKGDTDNNKIKFIKSLYKKYFLLAFLGMLLTMILLPLVYKILFAKYLFSYKYAVIYSISILAIAFYPAFLYFYEKRNIKFLTTVQIISLIIGLFGLFLASIYFGLWGAILLSIILRFSNNIICALFLSKNN